MEDENGLELSLGLSYGVSTGKSKGKDGSSSSDTKTEDGSSNEKAISDLKNFLHAETEKKDPDNTPQRSDPSLTEVKTSQENFFTNLTESSKEANASVDLHGSKGAQFTRYGGLWVANNGRTPEEEKSEHQEIGEKLWPEAGNKRKLSLEDMNHQNKHEREIQHADVHSKSPSMGVLTSMKTSHISVTTDDGSTADNEDVAESELEGSSSKPVSHLEDGTKRYRAGSSSSEAPKESHGFTNSSVKDVQEQRQSKVPNGNENKHGNLNYGIPMSFQPHMTVPYSLSGNVSNAPGNGAANTSGFPLPCLTQPMRPTNSERPGTQSSNPASFPATFGYSPVQLPVLETGNSWGVVSHPQQFPHSYAGRSIGSAANSDKSEDALKISQVVVQAPPHSSSESKPYDRNTSELANSSGRQQGGEEGLKAEYELKGNSMIFGTREACNQPAVESLRHEGLAIRPGIAPGLKIGGCGSYPDLPWVSITGPSPNGRTISGVTYRYDNNQMKIVCACHGSHMSPEEFVLHASSDHSNPESNAEVTESAHRTSSPAA